MIIWSDKAEGILKYSHNESVQRVCYNPKTDSLASCTNCDFGLWSPSQKAVAKYKLPSKVLSAAWSNDGQFLALGMYSGQISIRDKVGAEKVAISREAPIWTLAWSPWKDEPFDVLAVGCWDQTLSFYQLSGIQHGKDKKLGFLPNTLSYFGGGEYMLVGGSDREVGLFSREGGRLCSLTNGERPVGGSPNPNQKESNSKKERSAQNSDWIWSCKSRPNHNCIAVGDAGGNIKLVNLHFQTVHGLYRDRYAFREHMHDVIVVHLVTSQRVRIKCRDLVKKVAVYKDRLAVQLVDRIHVYDLSSSTVTGGENNSTLLSSSSSAAHTPTTTTTTLDSYDMHYRIKHRIYAEFPTSLLVVVSQNLVLCSGSALTLLDFQGTKVGAIHLGYMHAECTYTPITTILTHYLSNALCLVF